MDYTVIQEHVNRLSDAMIAKGLRKPRAEFDLRAHVEPRIYLVWEPLKKNPYEADKYLFFTTGTIGEMIAAAASAIDALPSAEEAKFTEFMGALGGVIDLHDEEAFRERSDGPAGRLMYPLRDLALFCALVFALPLIAGLVLP